MRMIDIPDGSKHGFPKQLPVTVRNQASIIDWLEKNGCPKESLHKYRIYNTKTPSNETTFDTILKWVLTPLIAWLTLDFSVEYFTGLWGEKELYRVWIAAIAITGLEVYLLRLSVLAENIGMQVTAAIAGGFIACVSVLGSLGAFEQGVANNTLQSDQYVSNKRSIESLQKLNDKLAESITSNTYLITNKRIRQNEETIDSLRAVNEALEQNNAAGSGNALFVSLSDVFGSNSKTMARNINSYTSLVFELALVVITLFGAWKDKQKL